MFSVVSVLLVLCSGVLARPPVEHIVALMMENRAFDHMCGRQGRGVNGVTGKEFNALLNGTRYYTQPGAPYIHPFDPDHSLPDTTLELFNSPYVSNPAPMSGFVQRHYNDSAPQFWTVMDGFEPSAVPALSALSENFAIFDEWFASLPGPTYPNRMFWHSGTTHGMTSNDLLDYIAGMPQRTMYDVLNAHNISWASYYNDITDLILFKSMRSIENMKRWLSYEKFLEDAAHGTLPTVSWVQPRFFPSLSGAAQDQHPDHDVVLGEQFIAEVYSALRNSPKWNSTVFVVTYDEHGGFWDHVPPPPYVPSPDGIVDSVTGFNFTRLGVRVCTVVASPLIPKGTVVHGAPKQGMYYEHSSFYATLKYLLNFTEDLTNRTRIAYPFHHVMSLAQPRGDCPTELPVPKRTADIQAAIHLEELERSPNSLQHDLFAVLEAAGGLPVTGGRNYKTQADIGVAARQLMDNIVAGRGPL